MVQFHASHLDTSFAALSDATRRGVLERLARSDASISELAQAFAMTLTGMKKHVGVLEEAGLVSTQKVGRVRTCRLGGRRLEEEAAWLDAYRRQWEARFTALDQVVADLQHQEMQRQERADASKESSDAGRKRTDARKP
jgi:DNA-binding transcriptional ArsR family regulator